MRRLPILLVFLALVQLSGAQALPTENGTYLQNGDRWDKLYVASTSGVRASGIGKTMLTYGIASAKSVLVFRDATAPVKTNSPRPTFRIVGDSQTAPRDIVIVRLQKKKDHRELQVGKVNAYTGLKFEYPPADTFEVDVKDGDGARILTPRADLKPGEYILFTQTPTAMPTGYGGYDFTVAP
jgi:hypothetical protein